MYKFAGLTTIVSKDLNLYSRQTYDILKMMGNVGGLFSSIMMLFKFVMEIHSD